jgi:hypothetical protein
MIQVKSGKDCYGMDEVKKGVKGRRISPVSAKIRLTITPELRLRAVNL